MSDFHLYCGPSFNNTVQKKTKQKARRGVNLNFTFPVDAVDPLNIPGNLPL